MNDFLPDYLEWREMACEKWYENVDKDGNAKCYCGKTFKLSEGVQMSPDPYAIPVCPDCFDEVCYQDVMSHLEAEARRKDQQDPSASPPSSDDVQK